MFIAHSLFLAISCEEIRSIPRDYIQNSKILIYFVCNIQVHKCVRRVVKAFVIGIPSEMDISHFSFNNFNNECGIETRHNIHEKPSKSKTIKITCSHPPPCTPRPSNRSQPAMASNAIRYFPTTCIFHFNRRVITYQLTPGWSLEWRYRSESPFRPRGASSPLRPHSPPIRSCPHASTTMSPRPTGSGFRDLLYGSLNRS